MNKFTLVVLSAAMLFAYPAYSAEPSGLEIMQRVDARDDGDDLMQQMKQRLIDRRGDVREREMASFRKDYGKDSKSITYFLEPSNVRDTALLTWDYDGVEKDDDQWLYLPALKKTRRIAATGGGGRFIGSDFSYEDLRPRDVADYAYSLLREETSVYVIEAKPLVKDTAYARHVLWIQKDNFQTVKMELYDLTGTLYKTGVFADYQKINKRFWRAYKITMSDHTRGRKTILAVEALEIGTGLTAADFTSGALER